MKHVSTGYSFVRAGVHSPTIDVCYWRKYHPNGELSCSDTTSRHPLSAPCHRTSLKAINETALQHAHGGTVAPVATV